MTAIEVHSLSAMEMGMTSDMVFLSLGFDGETECPNTMACKTASSKIAMKILSKLVNMTKTEIGFLRMLQSDESAGLRVPKLYYAYHNSRTEHFIVLMQDMRPARPGKQLRGCQVAEAHGVLQVLAQMHGHYWENYQAALRWTVMPNDPKKRFLSFVLADAWPKFIRWASPHAEAGTLPSLEVAKSVAQEVLSSQGQWMQEMAKPPLTVIHGDCHSENYLWPEGAAASGEKIIAIDFQLATVGQGLFDVANFLLLSMDSELLQKEEEELLMFYHTKLAASIAVEFTMEEFRNRYAAGMVYTLILEAVGQGTMDTSELANEGLQSKRLVLFRRILDAINRTACPTLFFTRRSVPPQAQATTDASGCLPNEALQA